MKSTIFTCRDNFKNSTYFNTKHTIIALCATVSLSLNGLANADNDFVSNARLPTDAQPTCTADIAPWFPDGQVSENGWVKPANSLDPIFANFADNTRCDFYKWGAQMFLWLTSGENDKHVFNSPPVFYNVSVADSNGKRTFLPSDGPMLLTVRKGKTDSEIELGQAGNGDSLISQQNSLVYYGLHANDLYALYATGTQVPNKDNLPTTFPVTSGEAQAVEKFAMSYGYPIWDLNALAIELKTSWIDADTVENKHDYVLTQAVVPIFDRKGIDSQSGKQQWTIIDEKPKTLAMVGMHLVGTVNAHPEMIWSTFEHVNNVPDAAYTYTSTVVTGGQNQVKTQAYDSSGTWNFIQSNAAEPSSLTATAKVSSYTGNGAECTKASPTDDNTECLVNSTNGVAISPIDILRVDPWGDKQSDGSNIGNTTDLVSINVSVLSQLKAGDIRGNYIQTGGIWTAKGQIPPGYPTTNPDYLRGSLNLANTTMETFYQFHNSAEGAFNPVNCFGCHGTTGTATGVSHIFGDMKPLPKK